MFFLFPSCQIGSMGWNLHDRHRLHTLLHTGLGDSDFIHVGRLSASTTSRCADSSMTLIDNLMFSLCAPVFQGGLKAVVWTDVFQVGVEEGFSPIHTTL